MTWEAFERELALRRELSEMWQRHTRETPGKHRAVFALIDRHLRAASLVGSGEMETYLRRGEG